MDELITEETFSEGNPERTGFWVNVSLKEGGQPAQKQEDQSNKYIL